MGGMFTHTDAPTAAAITAEIAAAIAANDTVDAAAYVAKAGDTMTGTLITTTVKPAGDSTRNVGAIDAAYANVYADAIQSISGSAVAIKRQDGTAWATTSTGTGATNMGVNTRFADNIQLSFGGNDDVAIDWSTAQATANMMVIAVGVGSAAAGGGVILTASGNANKDHDHAAASHPTIFVHSATDPDTSNTQFLSIYHDGSKGVLNTGGGELTVNAATAAYLRAGNTYNVTIGSLSNNLAIFRSGIDGKTYASLAQVANTSGTPHGIVYTAAAHTGLTVAETIDQHWDNGRTVTFTTGGGTIALQRSVVFEAPTYAAGAATTCTVAATVYIDGAPAAGTNMTLTDTYALFVDSGIARFDGDGTEVFELPADATDPTGGGGAATGRIPVSIGGATKYLAYY